MSHQATAWAFAQKLSDPLAKLVLLHLADHENGKSRQVNPSLNTIADETGLSRQSVCNKLAWLEKHGLIARMKTTHITGRQVATNYELLYQITFNTKSTTTGTVHHVDSPTVNHVDRHCPPQRQGLSTTLTVLNKNLELEPGKKNLPPGNNQIVANHPQPLEREVTRSSDLRERTVEQLKAYRPNRKKPQ